MRKTIFGYLGAAAVALALQFTTADVQAGLFSICNPCDEVCSPCDDACDVTCGTSTGKWFVNGHLEAGFYANEYGQTCGAWHGNSPLLLNTMHTGAQGNQLYIAGGKKVDGRKGLDVGGTVSATWGSDAWIVQTRGLEVTAKDPHGWGSRDYYGAIDQAYMEAEYGRWNVKAGKIHAPFGSSRYTATDNFFYSWASTAAIAPHVAGGAYATYKVNNQLSVMSGWITPGEIGYGTKYNGGLGGVNWQATSKLNVFYVFTYAENKYGAPTEEFYHTLLTTYQYSKRLKFVFEWTFVNIKGYAGGGHGIRPDQDEDGGGKIAAGYGINNEVIYCLNKNWSLGGRFGLLSDNGFATGSEWYTVALGANWTPNKWLTVKPELRYDWTTNPGISAFNGGRSKDQFAGGMSAVVKF